MDQLTFVIGAGARRRAGRRGHADRRRRRRARSWPRSGRAGRDDRLRDRHRRSRRARGGWSMSLPGLERRPRRSRRVAGRVAGRRQRARPAARPRRWSTSTWWSTRDPAAAARSLARSRGGAPFPLSERHGAWRVVRDGHTVDITAQPRARSTDDLGRRDFTINAMAVPLAGGDLLDPARRPRRPRGAAAAGGLRADLQRRSAAAAAPGPARPRARVHGRPRLRAAGPPRRAPGRPAERRARPHRDPAAARARPPRGRHPPARPHRRARRRAARGGGACAGVEQSPFHHLDVFEHTLQVLDAAADIAAHPEHYLREAAAPVRAALDADGRRRASTGHIGLRLAALFHDVAKPPTRVAGAGRPDRASWATTGWAPTPPSVVLERWKASQRADPLLPRARRASTCGSASWCASGRSTAAAPTATAAATAPYTLESIVLSLADRLATRGRARAPGVPARARRGGGRADRAHRPTLAAEEREPLLRGDEIAQPTGARGPASASSSRRWPRSRRRARSPPERRRSSLSGQYRFDRTAAPLRRPGRRARLERVRRLVRVPAGRPRARRRRRAGLPGGGAARPRWRGDGARRRPRRCSSTRPTGVERVEGEGRAAAVPGGGVRPRHLRELAAPHRPSGPALDEMARVLAPAAGSCCEDFVADPDPAPRAAGGRRSSACAIPSTGG